MLIVNNMECESLSDFSSVTSAYEVLAVRCRRCVFCVCYRPPGGDLSQFLSFMDGFLEFVNINQYELVLGGDFNINFLVHSKAKTEFESLLSIHSCRNVITLPTRLTETSETLLDLFITNSDDCSLKSGVINYPISDHLPIFLSVNHVANMKELQQQCFYRCVNTFTLSKFRNCISNVEWNDVLNECNPEIAYDKFMSIFTSIYYRCFPSKITVRSKKARKPWITSDLLKLIANRNKLYQRFVQTKCLNTLKEYKVHRNQVTKELRSAKRRYHYNLFASSTGQSGEVWKKMKSLFGNSPQPVTKIVSNGVELTGAKLANAFNDCFLSAVHPTSHVHELLYMKPSCNNTVFLEPVTEGEIIMASNSLRNNRSTDMCDLQVQPVKHVIDLISHCLVHIFNICLASGTFPRNMQCAKITAIYKKGDKNDLFNYRPISILPIFSKVFEKLILKRLTSFTERYNILTPAQYGFRKNKSTELALLEQKEFILQNFENKNMVLGIFLDFTKAFDLINHDILLLKLQHYGIRGTALSLISSYLQHRSQYVEISGRQSAVKRIAAGVPQGSVLGPFLFVLYINEIAHIDDTATCIIYADDTSLFFSGSSGADLSIRANQTLGLINEWAKNNYLKLNINKTKAIMFHLRNKSYELQPLILNNVEIELVNSFKTLGVHFSENMTWDSHVEYLVKLSSTIGFLRRHCFSFPIPINIMLYNSLFMSQLNYGSLIWGTTTMENTQRLLVLQKRIVRMICRAPYLSYTSNMFKKLNIIRVDQIYNYRLCRYYKGEVSKNCKSLTALSRLEKYIPQYPTRHTDTWIIRKCRTNYGKQMVNFQLPTILNELARHHNIDILSISFKDLRKMFI